MTSYAAVLQNALKFSLAPSALAKDTLYLSLERRKKRKIFCLRPRRAEKLIFCTVRRKRVNFLKCRWFCPLWKNFCVRPWLLVVFSKSVAFDTRTTDAQQKAHHILLHNVPI